MHQAFSPPLGVRLSEGAGAVRAVLGGLPLPVGLEALARTAARVGPLRARLNGAVAPLTAELAAVEQAIVWSVALYLALRARVGRERALALVDRVIVASGVRLMGRAFPPLAPQRDPLEQLGELMLPALRHAERHGLYRLGPADRSGDTLTVRIAYCHYVACCAAAGVPELARSYCNVDGPFFSALDRRVTFACPGRLSGSDAACTFIFSRRET